MHRLRVEGLQRRARRGGLAGVEEVVREGERPAGLRLPRAFGSGVQREARELSRGRGRAAGGCVTRGGIERLGHHLVTPVGGECEMPGTRLQVVRLVEQAAMGVASVALRCRLVDRCGE